MPAQRSWALAAGVVALTALAYVNSRDGQFVYDDGVQILRNPAIRSLENISRVFTQSVWQFMSPGGQQPVGAYYRPLFNVALIVSYRWFGFEVLGWHLASLLLHCVATLLVFLLAREWGLALAAAAVAALLFGLHPVHSESVAWISGLPDPLAAVFVLAALVFYEKHRAGGRRRLLAASLACFALALLSKEIAIVVPAFLLLRERPVRRLRAAAPFVVIALFYLGLRYSVLGFISQVEPKARLIPGEQVWLTIPSTLLAYARLLVIPYPLAVTYDHAYVTTAADRRFWGAALALIALVAATVKLARASPPARLALAVLILFLLPVLNLKAFNQDESLVHDRYLYLPSVGFCLLASLALGRLRDQRTFLAATAGVAAVLFFLTARQNRYWHDNEAMVAQALRVAPRRPFLFNYLGAQYFLQNRLPEAERYYRAALQSNPNYYDSLSNLADLYRLQGRNADAAELYRRAIEAGAPYAQLHFNLGAAWIGAGKLAEAEAALLRATKVQPRNAAARYNLGWVYDQQRKNDLAERAYSEALRLSPSYLEPRINLANVLTRQGRTAEAAEHWRAATRYHPQHPTPWYALGDLHLKTRQYPEAIEAFRRLVQIQPKHPYVHTSLGLAYEALGDRDRARTHFRKAVEVAPGETYTQVARRRLAETQ